MPHDYTEDQLGARRYKPQSVGFGGERARRAARRPDGDFLKSRPALPSTTISFTFSHAF